MNDFEEIKNMLATHTREAKASEVLHQRVDSLFSEKQRIMLKRRRLLWRLGGGAVAAVIIGIIVIPFNMSAKKMLSSAIDALKGIDSVEMTIDVRTLPKENFSYIDLSAGFVPHRIISEGFDSIPSWSIDKGVRAACGTDSGIFCWLKDIDFGWSGYSSPAEVLGPFETFISPRTILETELRQCEIDKKARYKVEEKDGDIILTVRAAPQGVFENPYQLNASIRESENIRRYIIDAKSHLLKNVSISVICNDVETEVLHISEIRYGKTSGIERPGNQITFVPFDAPEKTYNHISPEKAARVFLSAFERWDNHVINHFMDSQEAEEYRNPYEGAILVELGEAFRSGDYCGVYVPYRLRLPCGQEKQWNLALRPKGDGGWVFDGGL